MHGLCKTPFGSFDKNKGSRIVFHFLYNPMDAFWICLSIDLSYYVERTEEKPEFPSSNDHTLSFLKDPPESPFAAPLHRVAQMHDFSI